MKGLLFAIVLILPLSVIGSNAFLEIPITIGTSQTPAISTEFRSSVGLGFTHFPLEFYSFRAGYGALMTFSPLFRQGTRDVYTSGFENDLEARVYMAYGFDGSIISFWPYIFAGPNLNLRLTGLHVFEMRDHAIRSDFGFRGGFGLKIRFAEFDVKIDTAAGSGTSGITLKTTIMFGFGIF